MSRVEISTDLRKRVKAQAKKVGQDADAWAVQALENALARSTNPSYNTNNNSNNSTTY